MASIFSTQNLKSFLRRKYFRPPSRPPPGRGPRGPPGPPGPPERASPPPEGALRGVSSAMVFSKQAVSYQLSAISKVTCVAIPCRRTLLDALKLKADRRQPTAAV